MRLIEHRTNIEKEIEKILINNKINFVFQYPIRCKFGYIADFFLPDYNLIIECDGERWHKNKLRDNHKTHYLIGKGYKILRLKGNEILNDLDGCLTKIQLIIRRCKNGEKSNCEGKRNSPIVNE